MRSTKKKIFMRSILGISSIMGISLFSYVSSFTKNHLTSASELEDKTETVSVNENSQPHRGPVWTFVDKENGIRYVSDSVRDQNGSYIDGFKAELIDRKRSSYILKAFPDPDQPLVPLISIERTFEDIKTLTEMPEIPNTVLNMDAAFQNCSEMTTFSNIPKQVRTIFKTFFGCKKLNSTATIVIPSTVTNMQHAFSGCLVLSAKIDFGYKATKVVGREEPIYQSFANTQVTHFDVRDPLTYSKRNNLPYDIGIIDAQWNPIINTEYLPTSLDTSPWNFIYKYASYAKNNLSTYLVPYGAVETTGYADISGTAVSKPTEIAFEDVVVSLKDGTVQFNYKLKNYFKDNKYIADVWSDKINIKLTDFRKVSGATDFEIKNAENVYPSQITSYDFSNYVVFKNLPNGAQYSVKKIEAIDYIAGEPPSSKLTITVEFSQSFIQSGDDFVIETKREIKKVFTNMKYREPTKIVVTDNTTPGILPSEYSDAQIKEKIGINNLPPKAYSNIVVTNRKTMDTDGFIAVKVYLSKYYNKDGILQEDSNWRKPNEENHNDFTNEFDSVKISGFVNITGESKIIPKTDFINTKYPFQIRNALIDSNSVYDYLSFENIPDNGKGLKAEVSKYNNSTGNLTISLVFPKFAKRTENGLEVILNHQENVELNTSKRFHGKTTINIDETKINKNIYPSQVTDEMVKRAILVNNPAPNDLGGTKLDVKITGRNELSGSVTLTYKYSGYLEESSNGGSQFTSTTTSRQKVFSGFLASTGQTRISPKSFNGTELDKGDITKEDFEKYFEILNLPKNVIDNPDKPAYIVKDMIVDREKSTITAIVELKIYFDHSGIYRNAWDDPSIQSYPITSTNSSFARDKILDDNWSNGKNWLYLSIGVAGFVLLLLIIIMIIMAWYKHSRDTRDYKIKRMVVENDFGDNRRLGHGEPHAPLLVPGEVVPGATTVKYIEHGKGVPRVVPSRPKQGAPISKMNKNDQVRRIPTGPNKTQPTPQSHPVRK